MTSSAEFLKAVRAKDIEDARRIATLNPWAVRGSEALDLRLTAAHIAVKAKDWEMLRFFETLENFDFDQGDVQGETPLIKAIVGKDLDIVKFLVSKGARLSFSNQAVKPSWNPVYVAACLGTQETLEYLLGLGLDPNEETSMQRTALTKACWMGREENVRVLLAHPDIKIDF